MSHNNIDTVDFYSYELLLTDEKRQLLHAVRKFMTAEVTPTLLEHWSRATFPFEIVPGLRDLGIAGLPYHDYGCGGRRFLLERRSADRGVDRCALCGQTNRAGADLD